MGMSRLKEDRGKVFKRIVDTVPKYYYDNVTYTVDSHLYEYLNYPNSR